jgi:STE24 endopeptidase
MGAASGRLWRVETSRRLFGAPGGGEEDEMAETVEAATARQARARRAGGVVIALCQIPAVVGSTGLLLVLLMPLAQWEPAAVIAWLGVGIALGFGGLQRGVVRCLPGVHRLDAVETTSIAGPWAEACRLAGFGATEVDLYVRRGTGINAFAIGCTSVCVTEGVLFESATRGFSCEQVCALLLHELGHLRNGDTRYGLALAWLTTPWRAVCRLAARVAFGWAGFRPGPVLDIVLLAGVGIAAVQSARSGQWAVVALLIVLAVCPLVVPPLDAFAARRCEFAADAFTAYHGYGNALAEALLLIEDGNGSASRDRLLERHPRASRRCARLLAAATAREQAAQVR